MSADPAAQALTATLARLRGASIAGQLLAIGVVHAGLGIALPLLPLGVGLLALLLANLWLALPVAPQARWRAAPLAWLLFDSTELGWQLYWSGGPANPFVSLFMVPIALAAALLPVRAVVLTAVCAVCGYSLLWLDHQPLPHVHGEFDLHLFGMWINFLISAAVVAVFGARVARTLGEQRALLLQARERSLRDEGLLAVASLAAGAAHALNTPLATMSVLQADLRDALAQSDPALRADVALLGRQIDACRDAVRQLVAEAQPEPAPQTLRTVAQRVQSALQRWRLLRPAFEVDLRIDPTTAGRDLPLDRSFDYLLINLLNNAADAAQSQGRRTLELQVMDRDGRLLLELADPGPGFASASPAPFHSAKPDGLGLGWALSSLICERCGGQLRVLPGPGPTRVQAELALDPSRAMQ